MTQNQLDLLDYIRFYMMKNRGKVPSYQEMADGIGAKSKSSVHRILAGLEERGHISRLPNRARAIKVLQQPMEGRS